MKNKLPHPYSYEGQQLIADISLRVFSEPIRETPINWFEIFRKNEKPCEGCRSGELHFCVARPA